MSKTIHAFDYLDAPDANKLPAVIVLFGDEPFLKRLVKTPLCRQLAGADDGEEVPFASFEGGACEWRDVLDELSTVSLFGGGRPRLAVVDEADDFVTRHRARLEKYVERPRSTGVLLLDVNKWPANTRLYKSVDKHGLQIECRAPEKLVRKRKVLNDARVRKWLVSWSKSRHDAELTGQAATLLVELVGMEFGMLDQELAKLALFAGRGGKITPEMVRDVSGGWRTKTTWDLVEAAADGDAAESLRQLDRLLQSGENPLALFGPIAWSLRRFATATRIYERAERQGERISLRDALQQAGFRPWPRDALERAERQLRRLGRERTARFYRWLLETDLALKGTHSHPARARFALERLFLRMAGELSAARR